MSQFYTNELISLEKKVEKVDLKESKDLFQIENIYEIDNCVKWILENKFETVCLQLPDSHLPDSVNIFKLIESKTGKQIFILGDTTYESCCVDFIAAEHVNSEAIIHFGPCCYSQTENKKIKLFYIYNKISINNKFLQLLKDFDIKSLVLVVENENQIKTGDNLDQIPVETVKNFENQMYNNYTVIFISENKRTLANFQSFYQVEHLYYYDVNKNPEKILKFDSVVLDKRKYFLIEKIKDAQTVGIVVATLSVKNYLNILKRIKALLKINGKKFYTLSLGKPNVAKLANFPEIDVFVIITCSKNEIFDSRDYYKPLVTPFHIEVALNSNYQPEVHDKKIFDKYDFNEILDLNLPLPMEPLIDSDVSLVTGRIRCSSSLYETSDNNSVDTKSLLPRNDMKLVENSSYGGGYLANRSWKGLEQNLGESDVHLAEMGRKGLAKSYENEFS